jgi:hypothetical protein
VLVFNQPEFFYQNSYYKYILTTIGSTLIYPGQINKILIDTFSKVANCIPLKTKTADEVAAALDKIISSMPITPRKLLVDAGGEFSGTSNAIYNIIVKKYKMLIYVLTDSDHKAAVVERFNRTLRDRLRRYMTENHTKRWIDYLPEAVANYNATYHRSIGTSPNLVSFDNRDEIFKKLYPNQNLKVKCKLKVGWKVRIPTKKNIFEKSSTPNWSEEIYTINKIEQVCSSRLKQIKLILLEQWGLLLYH